MTKYLFQCLECNYDNIVEKTSIGDRFCPTCGMLLMKVIYVDTK